MGWQAEGSTERERGFSLDAVDIVGVDIDVAQLRAMLALRGLRHGEFAQQTHIGRAYFSSILQGHKKPGELTRIRIASGLARHGISMEEVCCGS